MSYNNHTKSNSRSDQISNARFKEYELENRKHDLIKSKRKRKVRYSLLGMRYFAEAIMVIFTWLKSPYLQTVTYYAIVLFIFGVAGDIIEVEDERSITRDIDRMNHELDKANNKIDRPRNIVNSV